MASKSIPSLPKPSTCNDKDEGRGKIAWRNSSPREVLLEDLLPGGILFGKDHVSARECWEFYKSQPGFEVVTYNQFRDRLRDHRKQVSTSYIKSQEEERALTHDRRLFPHQKVNNRGKVVLDMLPARDLLREDITNNRHVGKTPSQFQKTRVEYEALNPKIFSRAVYQQIRRRKFVNYLNSKREKARNGIPKRPKNQPSPFA